MYYCTIIYAANTRILFIIKCIFDIEVTFINSFMFVVVDVQVDIFSMQYASIFAIFAYSQRIYSTFNVGLHYTLHSNYFSAQLLLNSAQSALCAVVPSLSAGIS